MSDKVKTSMPDAANGNPLGAINTVIGHTAAVAFAYGFNVRTR